MACIVVPVRSKTDLTATTTLFTAYAASLGIDLSFQDFATEMASMPGKYAPPHGELLLAKSTAADGAAIGCVGIRPLKEPEVCELKRLYIPPSGRGKGTGKKLLERAIEVAAELGYQEMRLDTLPSMDAAIGLYRKAGFEDMGAYYDTPLEGTMFFRKWLTKQDFRNDREVGVSRRPDMLEERVEDVYGR